MNQNGFKLFQGDCLEVMKKMKDNAVDSIVCDPPYALTANKKGGSGTASVDLDTPYGRARIGTGNGSGGFMGMKWDNGIPPKEVWAEALRIAKPGAFLVAFGGTRTFHRLTCAIEDAGWEIRDCLSWMYGSGFPKSRDISKDCDKGLREIVGIQKAPGMALENVNQGDQNRTHIEFPKYSNEAVSDEAKEWQGWGTALKPAWEPIILARKPFNTTVVKNVLEYGTGAINIDACRIETNEHITNHSRGNESAKSKGIYGDSTSQETHQTIGQNLGRWPANVILDEEAGALLDEQSGVSVSAGGQASLGAFRNGDVFGKGRDEREKRNPGFGDKGGASRFFYCAKASRKERDIGLETFEEKNCVMMEDDNYPIKTGSGNLRYIKRRNIHPTVKPIAVMKWLCKLVTPPNGIILDPFVGSGSTGCAAVDEGFKFIGIDLSEEYIEIAKARINHFTKENKNDN